MRVEWREQLRAVQSYHPPISSLLGMSIVFTLHPTRNDVFQFRDSRIGRLAKDPFAIHYSVNSLCNITLLRVDMNGPLFDQNYFVFTPIGGRFVVHFIRRGAEDYAHMYHLRITDLPTRLRRHYLYARFAYSVFSIIEKEFVGMLDKGVAVPIRYSKPKSVPKSSKTTLAPPNVISSGGQDFEMGEAGNVSNSFSEESDGPSTLPDDIRPLDEEIITNKQELEEILISRVGKTLGIDSDLFALLI